MNQDIVNYENGFMIFGQSETEYRMDPAISNSDLSLVAKDPALVEWNRKIGNSLDLISPSVKEGKLFHKLLLETNFWNKVRLEPKYYNKGCLLIERIAEVHGNEVATYTDQLFSTITGLRNQLKKDGFPVKATSDIDECLKVISENSLDYRFLDKEIEKSEENGYDFLTSEQMTKFYCMIESLMENGDFEKLYNASWNGEVSIYLKGDVFNYKARLDMLVNYGDTTYIVDIKTISNLDLLHRNIHDFGYYRQAAFYTTLLKSLLEKNDEQGNNITPNVEFLFAFVETTPKLGKYRSLVAKVSEDHLSMGFDEAQKHLDTYLEYLGRDKEKLHFVEI